MAIDIWYYITMHCWKKDQFQPHFGQISKTQLLNYVSQKSSFVALNMLKYTKYWNFAQFYGLHSILQNCKVVKFASYINFHGVKVQKSPKAHLGAPWHAYEKYFGHRIKFFELHAVAQNEAGPGHYFL